MAFTWSNDLETGNIQIDSEHKQLIEAINNLLESCKAGKGRQELEHTINFLSDYTKTHFSHEEKLQLQYRFPDYPSHKNFHISYIKQIDELMAKIKEQGPTIALVGEVNLKASILISHIKISDAKLAKFIKENKK